MRYERIENELFLFEMGQFGQYFGFFSGTRRGHPANHSSCRKASRSIIVLSYKMWADVTFFRFVTIHAFNRRMGG